MRKDTLFGKRIFPILFMFIVTVVCIAIVSGIFLSTEERVKLNESIFLKRAVLYAANIPVPETPEEIQEVWVGRIEPVPEEADEAEYFRVLDEGGNLTGYVIFSRGPGLWGEIEAVVGFQNDLDTLTGVEFTAQNETPGLGARITESWFKEQFRGKEGPFELVPEGTADEPDEIDAITGATRTSQYVRTLMNNAVENAGDLDQEI
jgi:Na+-transporting NADH:ubiquinone oxidoreductase subunit C